MKEEKYKLSKLLKKEFRQFLEYHPAKRVGRNIREVIMHYMQHSLDGFPLNMDDILWDFTCLMELFDVAEEETKDWPEL